MSLSWERASDDVGVAYYEVYGSKDPDFDSGPETLLGTSTTTGFTHEDGLGETWHYRVRAVDGAGNAGEISEQASATTGSVLAIEAESLLPPEESSAPAVGQGNCCGAEWSDGAQIWFQSGAGDSMTLSFEAPKAGTYDLSAILTKAPDYGIHTLSVDGELIGEPFDGYNSGNAGAAVVTERHDYGQVELTEGTHALTFTVDGKNSASGGFFAGVDLLEFDLAD